MTEKIKQTLKDSPLMRWFIMVLVSGLTFSTYWFQDFYSGLKPLMESQMGITSSEFGTLIGLTTIANVFGMIIVGGIILDKWGIRLTGVVFGAIATLGGALNALGAAGIFASSHSGKLTVMIIGRILFGTGLEVTCVVVLRALVKWFKGYELALAMAISMGFGRLGSALAIALSPDIAHGNVPVAVNFAASLIGISLIMFLAYLMFDVKIDKQLQAEATETEDEQFKFSDLVKLVTDKTFIFIALLCVAFYSAVFPFMQYAPDLLVNKFGFTYNLPASTPQVTIFGSAALGSVMIYIGLFIFGIAFPLVPTNIKNKTGKIISILVILILFLGFLYILKDTLAVWVTNGPKVASLIPMGTILFTPIFGSLVDKKGKAASLMILGALLLIFAHISLSIFQSVGLGYLGLLCLGVAFSLVPASMWPSVAKIVPKNRLGTAYAAMFTIQNWGLMVFYWAIGKVLDMVNPAVVAKLQEIRSGLESQGLSNEMISQKIQEMRNLGEIPQYNYTIPILMLVVLGVISIFLAFLLKKYDKKQGYGLELSTNAK
ncbi:MAG: MFS transporter [Acidobacteria bacterium]|jgi:MFS family permease|nr:MFS transporter [Acidobacteriota bacterium]